MNPLIAGSIALLITTVLVGLFPVSPMAYQVSATILGGNALLFLALGILVHKMDKN